MKYALLICEVPHDKGERVTGASVNAGSSGGTVLMGRSISASNLMAALNFGEKSVDLVYILTENEKTASISNAIVNEFKNEKSGFGFMLQLQTDSLIKQSNITRGENQMNENAKYQLLSVILNKGYADDAMAAARKAGAGGGTVINARGTAREDDAKFFGMHIVPEKEMLIMVVEKDKKEAVLEAIRTLPCLSQPGSGIAFSSDVEEFTLLGR